MTHSQDKVNFSTDVTPKRCLETRKTNVEQNSSVDRGDLKRKALETCEPLIKSPGIHSNIHMKSVGFKYTNNGDEACCDECKLSVSNWTSDMKPFTIHSERSPTCPVVLNLLPPEKITTCPLVNLIKALNNGEYVLRADTIVTSCLLQTFTEIDKLKQLRKRTFSHWPHRSSPSRAQMIEAGFFNCNIGDRVICIYCSLICHQWTPNSDDPCEIHKILSPKCPYVIFVLASSHAASTLVINEQSTSKQSPVSTEINYTATHNTAYSETLERHASFATWPNENLPPVNDLVRAGFFFTGTKTIVTCFYCNGSLQNWGPNDNPTIEHARRFPHCEYAKQLCGAELYRKIQESKRAQQEKAKVNDSRNRVGPSVSSSTQNQLLISDESTLSRLVAARLDLPISQSILDCNYKLSIVKRCWEDQLRLKHDDFVSDCDVLMACMILQKQIECINGKKENITVPSVAMRKIREREQTESHDVGLTAAPETNRRASATDTVQNHTNSVLIPDDCVLWLAMIPCGHSHHQLQGLASVNLDMSSQD